jgi:hypothetical protein
LDTAQPGRVAQPSRVRRTGKLTVPDFLFTCGYGPLLTTHRAVGDEASKTDRHGLGQHYDYQTTGPPYLGLMDTTGGYHLVLGQHQECLETDCQEVSEKLLYLYFRNVMIIQSCLCV